MTNQYDRPVRPDLDLEPDLDLDLIVAFDADIGRAKVFNKASGEFEWHVGPKEHAIEAREASGWRERADGGRLATAGLVAVRQVSRAAHGGLAPVVPPPYDAHAAKSGARPCPTSSPSTP